VEHRRTERKICVINVGNGILTKGREKKMTKSGKDSLIAISFIAAIIALLMLFGSLEEPIEIPKRPKKPSYEEQYQKLMKERVMELEKELQEPYGVEIGEKKSS